MWWCDWLPDHLHSIALSAGILLGSQRKAVPSFSGARGLLFLRPMASSTKIPGLPSSLDKGCGRGVAVLAPPGAGALIPGCRMLE